MEEEQGDLGPGSSVGASKSPLSGKLPCELLVESMGGGNQIEESYEEGDGGEIMVAVVGSDVFVDVVSGHNGDLEGHETGSQKAMDVWNEGDGNKMGESDVGFLQSRAVCDLGDEVWNPGIEAKAVSSSAVIESPNEQTEEVMETTPVMISEEKVIKYEEVNKDSANFVKSELLNHHVEDVEGKVRTSEKKEILPSSGNDADLDQSGEDSMTSHEATNPSDGAQVVPSELPLNAHAEGQDNVQVGGTDGAVGEVGLVNATEGGEVLATDSPKDGVFKSKAENARTDSDCGVEAKFVDEKEVLAAESKDSILKGTLEEFQGINCGPTHGTDDASHSSPGSSHEKSFVSERDEVVGVKFDDVLDSKNGASDVNLPDLSCGSSDEHLKNDGELETDMVHQNHIFSNEPTQQPDGGDIAEVSKVKGVNIEIQADTEENQPNTMTSSSPGDTGIVQADSGMNVNELHIATSMGEVIIDHKVAISRVKVVDGDGSSEKDEEIDPKISVWSLEHPGNAEMPALDASTESMLLSAKVSSLKVETADVKVAENHVICDDPAVNVEVELDIVVGDCESPQSKEQEVAVQITETAKIPVQLTEESNHGVDKLSGINLTPNEVTNIAPVSVTNHASILPEITEKALLDGGDITETWGFNVAISSDEVNKSREAEDNSSKASGSLIVKGHTSETKLMDVEEERESDRNYDGGMVVDCREPKLGTEECASETDKLKLSNEETIKSSSLLRMYQPGYLSPPENEGHFAQSDLVWGKVQSHPWWPGQIFDQADASENAVKYYRKDSYLVAYFGDQTFTWNDASVLKPFMPYFSQIEKESNSEAFQNAVNCALEEVSRRVELGLACSCIPKDAYVKIETQVLENTGIREESSRRYGVDHSSRATSFEPDKLLEYVRDLAPCASSGADRLDLVISRAQLSAFCRFKRYRLPTEFPSSGELLENDKDTEQVSDEIVASHKHKHKHKHTPPEGSQSRKERSLAELLGDTEYSPDAEDESVAEDLGKSVSLSSGIKRKALDPLANGSDKRVSIYAAKLSTTTSQTPKPSFKIGECIRKVASQITGSASLVKGNNDETVIDGSPKIYEHSEKRSVVVSAESFSVNGMLLQLQLVAQDPKKRHNVQNSFYTFFLGFRSSIALSRRGRKKKAEPTIGSGEEFEFDDVNDSYWTDRIVRNCSEEQLLHDRENGAGNLQIVPIGAEKYAKTGHKSHSRKRFSSVNYPTAAMESDDNFKRQKQDSSPAELILNFAERKSVPSEINLNKIFRRFGPLMESETEVDHDSGRAKVIFKRGSDAEVAHNSAEKFNIFGPVLVNYQIGYSPLISVKILPLAVPQYPEDETLML